MDKGGAAGDQRRYYLFLCLSFSLFFFFLDNYHVQVNYIIGDIREIGSLFLYSVG